MSIVPHAPAAWQAGFLSVVPAVQTHARIQFRHLPRVEQEEATQEAIAAACQSYQRLAVRGRLHAATPATIATFAVNHVRQGRHVGSRQDSAKDVLSPRVHRCRGVQVEHLDPHAPPESWQSLLLIDRKGKLPIPDLVAFRLDFEQWLRTFSPRHRRIIAALAGGQKATAVARRFGLTPGRISQLRSRFQHSWRVYQKEPSVPSAAAPQEGEACRRGGEARPLAAEAWGQVA